MIDDPIKILLLAIFLPIAFNKVSRFARKYKQGLYSSKKSLDFRESLENSWTNVYKKNKK